MSMYNLIEYSGNYLYNIKEIITGQTSKNGTKNVEIIVPLKDLSNFWKTLEMPLINCEIDLQIKVQHSQYLIQNFMFQL